MVYKYDDRGAWHAAVYGVTKSWTQLSDQTKMITTNTMKCVHSFLKMLNDVGKY